MPTPVKYFIQVAQKWGNVDPNDTQAIEKWFLNDFPKLPKKEINAILGELIENSNAEPGDPGKIVYPSEVPLPLFKDILPVSGISWAQSYKAFLKYLQKLIKSNK
jgi:hypothetical protein